jgi:hypothetical protein
VHGTELLLQSLRGARDRAAVPHSRLCFVERDAVERLPVPVGDAQEHRQVTELLLQHAVGFEDAGADSRGARFALDACAIEDVARPPDDVDRDRVLFPEIVRERRDPFRERMLNAVRKLPPVRHGHGLFEVQSSASMFVAEALGRVPPGGH